MFSRLLIIAMLSFVLVAATACSSGDTPTAVPESTVPTEITQLAQELPALTDLGPGQDARQTSAVTQYIQLDQCSYLSNAVVSPTSVELPSAATQMSAAWWGITLSYQVNSSPDVYLPVPYLAPYEVRITASGSGEYWVALPDYKLGCWNFLPDKYASGNVTIPVGLEPNAGSLAGTFTIAIITYGGSDITVTEIAMDFPEPLNSTQAQPIEYQQMIEAADGTELATTVFLPYYETSPLIPNPPYPVVLFRTPYDKDEVLNTEYQGQGLPSALALANIVMIAQYHRGRFNDSGAWPDSGGTETLFRDHAGPDHTDAIDTMDWIEGRQWYNGTTVLSGPSALGLWIYQAAPVLGDRIAAIYPQVSSGNVGNWAAMRFGCFKRSNVEGWIVGNSYPPALLTEAETQFNNEAYWTAIDFDDDAGDVTCPGYHEVGWWDVDVESTIYSWQELNNHGGTGALGNHYLLIGPWSHDTVRGTTVGELTFPTTSADVDPSVIPQAWDGLQWAMKPLGRNPLFTTPTNHVRAYFIGSDEPAMQTTAPHNHWYELNTWPPVYSDHFLFLSSGATGLSDLAPVGDSTVGWECNPANPVLTSGGANLPVATVADAGPYDQVALEMRTDVLTFRSAALADDLPIAGPATITLFVETDAVDTDIMVKLIDEYPDGRNMLVADSGVRLSWYTNKTGLGDPAPNTVYEVTMDIGQRAYVFGTGHKVGIDIQSTNYPRFDINPGNGDPFIDGPNGVIQNNTLHMSETQISRLSLPEYDPTA